MFDQEDDVVKDGSGLPQDVDGAASTDHRPLVQVQAFLLHGLHHAAVPQVQRLPDASSVGGPAAMTMSSAFESAGASLGSCLQVCKQGIWMWRLGDSHGFAST